MGVSSSKDNKKLNRKDYDNENNPNYGNDIIYIKNQIENTNLAEMKSDIKYIKEKIEGLNCCDEIKNEISTLKVEMVEIKNLLTKFLKINIPSSDNVNFESNNNKNQSNIISSSINKNLNIENQEGIYNIINQNKNTQNFPDYYNMNNININNNLNNNNNLNVIPIPQNQFNNKKESGFNLKLNNFDYELNKDDDKNQEEVNKGLEQFENKKIKSDSGAYPFINYSPMPTNKQKDLLDEEKSDRNVTVSMNGKDYVISINDNTTFVQFKNICMKYFNYNNNVSIHYFNTFGVKKIILNENDFKNSLIQKIFKYYFVDTAAEKKAMIFQPDKKNIIKKYNINNNINNIISNKNDNHIIVGTHDIINNNNITKNNNKNIQIKQSSLKSNNDNFNLGLNVEDLDSSEDEQNIKVNLIQQASKKDNVGVNYYFKNNGKKYDIGEYKKNVKDVMEHFASCAFIKSDLKIGDYINSAVYLSYMMKKINLDEQKNYPFKFYNKKEILKYPGLISNVFHNEDYIFILSLIAQILEEKGINVSIYKENEEMDKADGATLQYLFNGFTEKKKYEIQFDLGTEKNSILLQKGDELNYFIEEWKSKISKTLNLNLNEVFLVNPKDKNGLVSLDFVSNEINIPYNQLKNYKEIKNIEEKSLIEGCQLNTDIFDSIGNNQDGGWGIGETRGGEKYIPPIGWLGYGLKVGKKYDNGDDTWLNYSDQKGVFAVAYFGISNIYGNKKNNNFLSEIKELNVMNMTYEQTYKNDINIRNKQEKCGNGVYLFQDPKIAENTAGIIDIGGVRYKVLLMCRVRPDKIRQPNGFPNCWILNPLPSEIRPYRILIKRIFQSALAGASQEEIKVFTTPPIYYKNIIQQKDTSFYSTNTTTLNNDDYVINLYSSNDYRYINNYLREGKVLDQNIYNEQKLKSWAWCLHNSLTKKTSNVPNSSICYRGVSRKFPSNLGIGSKFMFGEFTSASIDKSIALSFASHGTLFIIRIENNNNSNYYCYNITKMSQYQHEKEVLITSYCTFHITNIENKDDKNDVDKIYLTCEGYKANNN